MTVLLQHPRKSPVLSKDIYDGGIKAFILNQVRLLDSTKSELSPFLWCHDCGPDFLCFSQVIFSLNLMGELRELEVTQLDTGVSPSVSNSRPKPLQFYWLQWKYITLASNRAAEKRISICMFSTMWYYRNQNKRMLNKTLTFLCPLIFLTYYLNMKGWIEKYYAV